MTLVKWSPAREFENIQRDVERIFEDTLEPFGRRRWWAPRIFEHNVIVPKVDMYDKKNEVVVKAELPRLKKEDIDITITKDSITLKGEIKKDEEVQEGDYYCSECTYGSFLRTIPLPTEIDTAKTKAVFKNGVLEIKLPKLAEDKSKEVKLKID
jgi:HSP20 family protein